MDIFSNIGAFFKDLFIPSENNGQSPRFLQSRVLLYLAIAILTLKILSIGAYLPISHNFFFADITKIDLLNLLNQNRQDLGLSPLTENEKLEKAAMAKAQDMVANGYFAHESPQGVTPWFWFRQAGYVYKYAGENLAVGFFDSKTVYDAWFNSPSHKANLLNKNYTEVGTAIVGNFEGSSILVVQEFGSPLNKVSTPAATKPVPTKPLPTTSTPAVVKEVIGGAADTQVSVPSAAPQLQETGNTAVLPKVLSQSTEYIEGPERAGIKSFYLQFLNFIVYDNNRILEAFSMGILALIVACLAINIILGLQIPQPTIALRSLVVIGILVVSLVINKDLASQLIIHTIVI